MSSAIGSITQLPARFKRSSCTGDKKEEVKLVVASTVHRKLEALRSKRVGVFFRAKTRQRAGAQALASVVGSSGSAVLGFMRSLRHLAVGFLSRQRGRLATLQAKWGRKLRMLPSALTGEKSMLSMLQKTLGRTFGRGQERKAQAERELRQQQARIYQWVCRTLARLGRSAIAAAHKRRRVEGAALLAHEVVGQLMKELSVKIAAMREHERLANCARVIQRLWRRGKRSEQAALDARARLLNLLTDLPSQLRGYQQTQQEWLRTVHDTSANTSAFCIRRAAQRLAVRRIQRVWRGHCARNRVRRIRDWIRRRSMRQRQRERLREARGALLAPSEMQRTRRRELEARMMARQQETPLLPLLRREEGRHHQRKRGERATVLEPLPLQSRPPHVSSTSRTKVQCVPFSRFEKIVAQDARVNLSNVWVAIPVGHEELPLENERDAGSRHGGLSPLLVGRGRTKKKGGLQTTYDWVPAHLLQSKEEREATASRRRQRATSPSVSKSILEF
ncbi:hypothetical protein PHYPSEUDO_002006 [Phytophthora pseudosyringae]|uniref:Uncharacterized protein n=1 Tax=Phytophthora pseudosyringae TaxID=221518 RepID=A0A8T1VZE3_9STRA|nr:hypothetical protein PHYPSEUDO_002006 [Phytophthora pseudosyringae]